MIKLVTTLMQQLVAWRLVVVPACIMGLYIFAFEVLWPLPSHEPTPHDVERLTAAAALGAAESWSANPATASRSTIPLSECVARNPFAVPDGLQPAFAAEEQAIVSQPVSDPAPRAVGVEDNAWCDGLLRKRVQVVYQTPCDATALVDSRIVHVGDVLDGAGRVVEIRLDGIVLERIAPVVGVAAMHDAALSGHVQTAIDQSRPTTAQPIVNTPTTANAQVILPLPEVLHEESASGDPADETVSLAVRNASIAQVLHLIAKQHGWTVDHQALLVEPITVSLFDLPLRNALEIMLQPRGFAWKLEAKRLVLRPDPPAEPVVVEPSAVVRVFQLKYLSRADVEPILSSLLSPSGKAHFAAVAGSDGRLARIDMLVIDEPSAVMRMRTYIARFDRPPPHVLIDAHICLVTLGGGTWQGVNLLPLAAEHGGEPGSDGARYVRFAANRAAAVLPALQSSLGAQAIAAPQMMVLNGEQAAGEAAGAACSIQLQVTPQMAGEGRVRLRIRQQLSGGQINPFTGAVDAGSAQETTVLLSEGETIVLGGLIHQQDVETWTRRRVLGGLPLIGARFQQRYVTPTRTEALIVLTPRIVRDTAVETAAIR